MVFTLVAQDGRNNQNAPPFNKEGQGTQNSTAKPGPPVHPNFKYKARAPA